MALTSDSLGQPIMYSNNKNTYKLSSKATILPRLKENILIIQMLMYQNSYNGWTFPLYKFKKNLPALEMLEPS